MSKFVFIKNIENFVDTRFARKLKATQKRCNSSRRGGSQDKPSTTDAEEKHLCLFPYHIPLNFKLFVSFNWKNPHFHIVRFFFGYTLGIWIWFHIVVLLGLGCCWVYCVWKIRKCKNSKENKRKWGFFKKFIFFFFFPLINLFRIFLADMDFFYH